MNIDEGHCFECNPEITSKDKLWINVKATICDKPNLQGDTYLDVRRVEMEDDGSLTVVVSLEGWRSERDA